MAERRMFSNKIVGSDAFMSLPPLTQILYFQLNMSADDDGFLNNSLNVARACGAGADELKTLISKRFIIKFDNGIIAIKHWKIHNYIQKDRYKPTTYQGEYSQLEIKDNKAYTERKKPHNTNDSGGSEKPVYNPYTECIQDGYNSYTQVRLGKDSLNKTSSPPRASASNAIKYYQDKIHPFCSTAVMHAMNDYLNEGVSEDLIILAIDEGIRRKAKSWNYIKNIINRCIIDKIFTAEDWHRAEEARTKSREKKSAARTKSRDDKPDYSDPSRYDTNKGDDF